MIDLRRGVEHVGQQPPGQRPAAVELARRGGASASGTGPRSNTARCRAAAGIFRFSAFFAFIRPGSFVSSGIWSYFSCQRAIFTSSSWAST